MAHALQVAAFRGYQVADQPWVACQDEAFPGFQVVDPWPPVSVAVETLAVVAGPVEEH